MSNQLQISGEAKIRAIQGPVVANSGVITALDGDASQYVRGDGTLADFPTSTGGGSSVSYYLNTSVSQGTIGGVAYKQLSKVPISGAGTDVSTSANGYIASYITDANDPALLEVPAGNFNCEFYFSVNSDAHNPYVYAEVYKYDGTTFTLLGSNVSIPQYLSNGTTLSPYYFAIAVSTSVLTVTDRIAIRIYVNVDGRTVTLHTENNHLCQVVTTFSKGIISLNNLTRQNQFFGTGTSGTDFAISSSVATHTFNLPVASASNTGKLSSTDWSTFNGKVPYTGATANVDLGAFSLTADVITGATGSFTSSGSSNTFSINHSSGAGIALNITKGGNNEGLYINKTSGSGNAATIVGTLEATTLVKTGGTSSQFLKADGTIDSNAYITLGSLSATSPIFYNSTTGVISSQAASATLEGYITTGTQTIAGLKTFSATLATNALIVGGQLTLYSNITNGSYTYTLPSATGTLALTSQIITISGTPNIIPRFNSAGTNIESGSIQDFGTVIGTPPAGYVTVNARLTVNNYLEVNRYLSIIQNVDSSWALPSTGTSLEAFVTSAAGGTLINDTAYLRPRKASDDTFKRFIIQGDDLILNDTTSRRTLINKSSYAQTATKLEVAGYTRFDAAVNINSSLQFNATDSTTPTYLQAPSGNVTLLTTGTITLGTNSVNKFVFDVNGALNLGTSDNSNIININNQFSTLNSTLQGVHITPSILSASNSVLYTGVKSYPQFFLSAGGANAYITHYSAINANNTANTANQIGVYIDNLISVSGSYGIQSIINTATGSYNLYISGTAHNYLKGRLGVDQTNPAYAIDVTGDVNVTGNFKVNGTNLTQGITGSGTQHYIPRYTSATSVGDSKIYQNPATNHVLVNTTTDYTGSGGYLQVGAGFTTESFANIIYGSAPYVGNTVTLSLVNGNTIRSTGDKTYFIENRINAGNTTADYFLNYWDGSTASTRYTLDYSGLHTFNGAVSISGATSIGGTLTGVNSTFSQKIGVGTTTGISASVTIYNTSEANQLKLAGAAPAAIFTDALSSATYTAAMGLVTATNNFILGTVAGEFVFVNQTNKAIIFGTGVSTTEKMRLTSGGKLLLGTTTDNGSLLQVAGAATFSGLVSVLSTSYDSGAEGLKLGYDSSYYNAISATFSSTAANNKMNFVVNSGNGTRGIAMTLQGNGNVGIGTSSPQSIVHAVQSNSTAPTSGTTPSGYALSYGAGDGNNGGIWFSTDFGGDQGIAGIAGTRVSGYTTDLRFYTNSTNSARAFTERMRITSGGTVAIGGTAASRKLQVNTSGNDGIRILTSGDNPVLDLMQTAAANVNARNWRIVTNWEGWGTLDFQSGTTNTQDPATTRLSINGTNGVITFNNYGTGTITSTSGVLSAVSDMNLKIEDGFVENALEKVMNLKPRYFLWKEESGLPTDLRQLGFYAQEVNQALGEEVANTPKDEKQNWGIYDRGMIAFLTAAIQEQQAQIEELKALILNK